MEKTEKIKNKEYRIQMRGIDQIMENGEVSSALQVLRIPATKQGSEMKKEKKRKREFVWQHTAVFLREMKASRHLIAVKRYFIHA